jgi:hypothetical protein
LVWADTGRNTDNNKAETQAFFIGRKIADP